MAGDSHPREMTIWPLPSGQTELGLWPHHSPPNDGRQAIPDAVGARRRPAGIPYVPRGMGKADRLAHRHGEARLEAVTGDPRGTGADRGLRPHQGRPSGTLTMTTQRRGDARLMTPRLPLMC